MKIKIIRFFLMWGLMLSFTLPLTSCVISSKNSNKEQTYKEKKPSDNKKKKPEKKKSPTQNKSKGKHKGKSGGKR